MIVSFALRFFANDTLTHHPGVDVERSHPLCCFQTYKSGDSGMDAWSRVRKLMVQLWPLMAVVLAVLLQFASLFAWTTTSGTSAAAMTGWALAVFFGFATALCASRIHWKHTAISLLSVCSVVIVSTLPASTELFLSLSVNSGLSNSALWAAAALPVGIASLFTGLLIQTASGQPGWKTVVGVGAGAALFLAHGWIDIPFAVSASFVAGLLLCGICLAEDTSSHQKIPLPLSGWMGVVATGVMTAAVGMAIVAGGLLLNRFFTISIATTAVATMSCCFALVLLLIPFVNLPGQPVRWWSASIVVASVMPWCFAPLVEWNLVANAVAESGASILVRHDTSFGLIQKCDQFVVRRRVVKNSSLRLDDDQAM